jgi:hypothetical protein
MTWSPFAGSNRGSSPGQLNFSEVLELLDFLSASRVPAGLVVSKHVSIEPGSSIVAPGSPMPRSVRGWASVLPRLLASPSISWAAHLTSLEVKKPSAAWESSGSGGEVVGEVVVLILSTTRRKVQGGNNLL